MKEDIYIDRCIGIRIVVVCNSQLCLQEVAQRNWLQACKYQNIIRQQILQYKAYKGSSILQLIVQSGRRQQSRAPLKNHPERGPNLLLNTSRSIVLR